MKRQAVWNPVSWRRDSAPRDRVSVLALLGHGMALLTLVAVGQSWYA